MTFLGDLFRDNPLRILKHIPSILSHTRDLEAALIFMKKHNISLPVDILNNEMYENAVLSNECIFCVAQKTKKIIKRGFELSLVNPVKDEDLLNFIFENCDEFLETYMNFLTRRNAQYPRQVKKFFDRFLGAAQWSNTTYLDYLDILKIVELFVQYHHQSKWTFKNLALLFSIVNPVKLMFMFRVFKDIILQENMLKHKIFSTACFSPEISFKSINRFTNIDDFADNLRPQEIY